MPLFRLGRRYLLRHPLQTLLVLLGIALGVAMVVAVELANGSASRAFALSTEAVTGRATHQIVGGPAGVPDTLLAELRRTLGLRAAAPVVTDFVLLREADNRPVRLLGVDPFTDAPFRSYLGGGSDGAPLTLDQLTRFLTEPRSVLMAAPLADSLAVAPGDTLTLGIGPRSAQVTVVGLLEPTDALSRRALDSLVLADVATAQELLGMVGQLSTIDLILAEGAAGEGQLQAIQARLPTGVRLESAAARTNSVAQLSAAFELNLTALSLLALVVGMFLIYNTVTFSVVQRRAVLGTLRALGVTRRELFTMILSEAALLGLVGALLGLLLGLFLGRGAVRLVTQTINDLYFTVSVEGVDVPPLTLVKGALLGIVAALLAALPPAWEAASVPPVTALRRSALESSVRRLLPLMSVGALVLGAVGLGLLLWPSSSIVVAFAGLFAVVIAFALGTPLVTVLLMALATRLLGRLGVLGRMAPRDVVRALSRSAVAIAALMVAVSVIVGVSVMVGSFRSTVVAWLGATLQADIYLSPPSVSANRNSTALQPEVAERVAALPGIERVVVARDVAVRSPELGDLLLVAASDDVAQGERPFQWVEESQAAAWARVRAGEALFVSEPLAFRHALGRGSTVTLETARGPRTFPVVGVFYDYSSDRGVALMGLEPYRALYDDPLISSVAAYVEPGQAVDPLVEQLRAEFAGEQQLYIRSNAGLRDSALVIFDRTFAITGALQGLATVVAFIGVLAALMALQLERARELGTLRAVGMGQRQLLGVTLLETGLMGGTAGLWAMPTGMALALVLIYVINRRSFGWTLQLHLEPSYFVQAMVVAMVAALLAGLYPAWRMSRLHIAEALRSE